MSWTPITDQNPRPLHDVLVSVVEPCDGERLVYMAWRHPAGRWFHTGGEQLLLLEPYAFDEVPLPAPLSKGVAA